MGGILWGGNKGAGIRTMASMAFHPFNNFTETGRDARRSWNQDLQSPCQCQAIMRGVKRALYYVASSL